MIKPIKYLIIAASIFIVSTLGYYLFSPKLPFLTKSNDFCIQKITRACFLKIPFVCRKFGSPCDVPYFWYSIEHTKIGPKLESPHILKQKAKKKNNNVTESVIVTLNIPFRAEGKLTAGQVEKQRALIKEKQNELISKIPGAYEVYEKYDIIPALAIKVDNQALEFLQNSTLVKSLSEDIPVGFDTE